MVHVLHTPDTCSVSSGPYSAEVCDHPSGDNTVYLSIQNYPMLVLSVTGAEKLRDVLIEAVKLGRPQ